MPTSASFDEHLAALSLAGPRLIDLAIEAGFDAPVPTCPTWDAGALVAHQAMVHRWATAQVLGENPDGLETELQLRELGAELVPRARAAHAGLVDALRSAPDDLVAMTFLNDAPSPRRFWARRQAHETTVHLADALAAAMGRVPFAAEVAALGVGTQLAVDGLDELLHGFFTRGRSKLWDGTDRVVLVRADDADRRWVLRVGEHLSVEADTDVDVQPGADTIDVELRGSALALYLGLWNRGDEMAVSGDPLVLARWREVQRVRWS